MTRRHARLSAVGIASIALSAQAVGQVPPSLLNHVSISGPVRVIQADTLEVSIDGMKRGVGIVGIAAPPGNTRCGRQATATAQRLVAGGIVLDTDERVPEFAGRFRRLHRVMTASGQLLATELALAGVVTAERAHVNARDFVAIAAAEAQARSAGRGCLWSS